MTDTIVKSKLSLYLKIEISDHRRITIYTCGSSRYVFYKIKDMEYFDISRYTYNKTNTSGSDYDTDSEDDWEPVEGEDGLFYKNHFMSPALKYGDQVTALLPKTEQINKILEQSKPKKYNHLETLEQHKFTLMNGMLKSARDVIGVGRERATYVSRMLLSELGLSQVCFITKW